MSMRDLHRYTFVLALAALCAAPTASHAAEIAALVRNDRGEPVSDAVVIAVPSDGPVKPAAQPGQETVDQVNHEFVPRVKVVLVGAAVSFPNKDNVRHHVYSFSPAKRFELPLYSGTPATPVLFDKPGVVVLGCNIHDWMIGYIYVSESPYFAKTGADGRALLADLPARSYTVRAWHPQMEGAEDATRTPADVTRARRAEVAWQLKLKPDFRAHRAPHGRGPGRY
jgi:plastocyanin